MALLKHVRQIVALLRDEGISASIVKNKMDGHLHLTLAVGKKYIGTMTVAGSPRVPESSVARTVRAARKLKEKKCASNN